MSRRARSTLLVTSVAVGAFLLGWIISLRAERADSPSLELRNLWHAAVRPGELSDGHAFLDESCDACHAGVRGIDSSKCIACHASDEAILRRQPTAFHAELQTCRDCHVEHLGRDGRTSEMKHETLSEIGLEVLGGVQAHRSSDGLRHWLDMPEAPDAEALLSCSSCHATKDRHFGLFGENCSECHSTTSWGIAEFVHPAPDSIDCVECHQAPPSHFMEHFGMVSQRVARQPRARVEQCYLCHQTTAWTDIRDVGVYKHH